jgi:hypothetical protein
MQKCSIKQPPCYGVSYNHDDGHCYLKTADVVGTEVSGGDKYTHSALVTPVSQLVNTDMSCQFGDEATPKTDNGLEFTVHCGSDIVDGDYCPPSSNSSTCPWHAKSLSDCMNQCSLSHPLCSGVSYNPSMEMGYPNCYPKNNFGRAGFSTPQFTMHSAIATFSNITTKCADKDKITASNNKQLTLQCNQYRAGNDISVYHETSLQKCADTCATYSAGGKSCLGVVFDSTMELGWENCYLKGATGTPLYNSTATFALITGVKDTSSSSSSSSSSTSSSSTASKGSAKKSSGSKAWVAGVVVAAIIALCLIAGFVVWKRKQRGRSKNFPRDDIVEAGYYEPRETASMQKNLQFDHRPTESVSSTAKPPVELADTQLSELQSSRSSKSGP